MTTVYARSTFGRFSIIFIIAMVFLSVPPVFAGGGLTKIADGVYSYVDVKHATAQNSFGANAGIVIGKDGIVVIDTLISAKEAKTLIKDVRTISDKPIKYVVNTHMHLDHTFGNCEFEKLGAGIIASTVGKQEMMSYAGPALKKASAFGLTEQDMEGTGICYPAITFEKKMEIDLGDRTVVLVHTGHSHTEGSIIVFVPDQKTLFAGDILFTNYHPNMKNGDIDGWVKALDFILTMDATTIVPGHGPVSGKKDVLDMKSYLVLFDQKAKDLTAKSSDVQYVVSELRKALPPRAELDMMIGVNVQMNYMKK
jgi:glyoxylase-like metal-dependent hydrolase (beta-lactamase superfamily II)